MNLSVIINTSEGELLVDLYREKSPLTVDNFVNYIDKKFYDGTIFHRVINNFMIQGGGYETGMVEKKTDPPILNEADNGLSNLTYTLAMARTNEPHSATAQFFINVADNKFLDFKSKSDDEYGYCVFGKVIGGMDTVNKIKAMPKEDFYLTIDKKDIRHLTISLDYEGPILAPVIKGTQIATMTVKKKDEIIKSLPLYAVEDLKKVNFFKSLITSLNYLIWGDV